MFRVLVSLCVVILLSPSADGQARRVHLSSDQISELANIRTILLSSSVLTEKGTVQSKALDTLVATRFQALGYTVVTDSTVPHDVEFRVFCEERKRFPGITRAGGDAELEDTPYRLWHGPACRFRYRLHGTDLGWSTEVRSSSFGEKSVALEPGTAFVESAIFESLLQEVDRSEFPLLVMAEWGHESRLAQLLLNPDTPPATQQLIVHQLAGFSSSSFLPTLLTLIQRPDFPVEAIEALATAGEEGLPHLVGLFEDRTQTPAVRAAAARGIGRIEGATGTSAAYEPMLVYLSGAVETIASPDDIEFPVLTAVVWSLGKSHSDRVLRLLELLQAKIWLYYDPSEHMHELREAVSVVSKYLDHVQL